MVWKGAVRKTSSSSLEGCQSKAGWKIQHRKPTQSFESCLEVGQQIWHNGWSITALRQEGWFRKRNNIGGVLQVSFKICGPRLLGNPAGIVWSVGWIVQGKAILLVHPCVRRSVGGEGSSALRSKDWLGHGSYSVGNMGTPGICQWGKLRCSWWQPRQLRQDFGINDFLLWEIFSTPEHAILR